MWQKLAYYVAVIATIPPATPATAWMAESLMVYDRKVNRGNLRTDGHFQYLAAGSCRSVEMAGNHMPDHFGRPLTGVNLTQWLSIQPADC